MSLTLFNTLSQKKEEFRPLKVGVVSLYHCGPTVYDYAHIGNLRAYVFADILRRVCEYEGFSVEQVINITDIGHLTSDADSGDDKMVKGLKREGLPLTLLGLSKLAEKYEKAFQDDLKALNIEMPQHMPRATECLPEEIELVEELEKKGFTYQTDDGIYFDTGKFPEYGKLGGLTPLSEQENRVAADEKKSPRDFVLWKFSKDGKLGFPSPWGEGFPGWHIECSAMSRKFLGQPFDIHTGGTDHIPIHHNNEIAQSEAAYGVPLANVWLHSAFITTLGEKMAKSAGTFVTLNDLKKEGYDALAYRYFLLGGHYRSQISFSYEALDAAVSTRNKLLMQVASLPEGGSVSLDYKNKFVAAIDNDLNTPQALAVLWEMIKDNSVSPADKRATILEFDNVLGLNLVSDSKVFKNIVVPGEVNDLVEEREEARKIGDFKKADELRAQIEALGFTVKDTSEGPQILSQ